MDATALRVCRKCHTSKPVSPDPAVSAFYADRSRADGFGVQCKDCKRVELEGVKARARAKKAAQRAAKALNGTHGSGPPPSPAAPLADLPALRALPLPGTSATGLDFDALFLEHFEKEKNRKNLFAAIDDLIAKRDAPTVKAVLTRLLEAPTNRRQNAELDASLAIFRDILALQHSTDAADQPAANVEAALPLPAADPWEQADADAPDEDPPALHPLAWDDA